MFEGPKLKIKRADHHIAQLQELLSAFCKTDFYSLRVEFDPKDGMNVLEFHQAKDIPCDVPLIIGDAAHNLRAALDLLVCDIVRAGGAEPTQYTKFALRRTKDELIAALDGGILKAARAGIIELIVDTIQPYVGGKNASLFGLHDLDIQDKHLLITPVFSVTRLTGVDLVDENQNVFTNTTLVVGGNGKLRSIATSSPLKITKNGQPSFNVLFDKGNPFERQPVIPTLHQLSQLVSGVVQTIEQAYLPSDETRTFL